jgi:hypothetical protein
MTSPPASQLRKAVLTGSVLAADRHVDCTRALGTPFGRHGVTGLLPNVVQYVCL